ncbi:MAG: twin-arginine translocation pathway signal protein, partial [Burkholderiaceae bacterium]|nr:twin-arginine translocation pathway signal protein [Burkholderiaceae bacterium]
LAVDEVRRATPDGSVVLLTPASVVTMYPHVYRQLAYDPFADLVPVSPVCTSAFALAVGARVPQSVTTVEGFARWCKPNPAAAQCGNAGAGSMPHLMALLLARELKLDLGHIPYRGGQLAMQAAAAGEVTAALATEAAARALDQSGRLRVLATSGRERSPFFPSVPTFAGQGLAALTVSEWFGVLAPARTPTATVESTARVLHAALQDGQVQETWAQAGLLPASSSPAQLAATMRQEHAFWGSLVKATGFTPET